MIDKKDSGISLTPPEPMTKENINKFIVSDDELRQRIINGVNKIDYKPNDLATVEFILIP